MWEEFMSAEDFSEMDKEYDRLWDLLVSTSQQIEDFIDKYGWDCEAIRARLGSEIMGRELSDIYVRYKDKQ